MSLLVRLGLTGAVLAAVIAAGTWWVFLRPVPLRLSRGMITNKTYRPAGTRWQYPVGANRGFQTAIPMAVAESYGFEIKVEGWGESLYVALNAEASKQFEIGQWVQIEYQRRGLPLVWNRVYVQDIKTAE